MESNEMISRVGMQYSPSTLGVPFNLVVEVEVEVPFLVEATVEGQRGVVGGRKPSHWDAVSRIRLIRRVNCIRGVMVVVVLCSFVISTFYG